MERLASNIEDKAEKNIIMTDNSSITVLLSEIKKENRNRIIFDLKSQRNNLYNNAMNILDDTVQNIDSIISTNRGGCFGIHGFIAEQLETGIGNAKSIFNGDGIKYILLDNNGRDDLLWGKIPVQMKFVQSYLSLDAISNHIKKYPEIIEEKGAFIIPKDYWEKINYLSSLSRKQVGKLKNTDYTLWKKLNELYDLGLSQDKIYPSEISYEESQKEVSKNAITKCKASLKRENNNKLHEIENNHKPNIVEASKIIIIGAGLEGVISGAFIIYEKRQQGIKLGEYKKQDVVEVLKASGTGTLKGACRSGFVYWAVNYTALPGSVASGMYTITERTLKIAKKNKENEISKEEMLEEVVIATVDTALTMTFSSIGSKCFKNHRIVGSVIGTVVAKTIVVLGTKAYEKHKKQKCA